MVLFIDDSKDLPYIPCVVSNRTAVTHRKQSLIQRAIIHIIKPNTPAGHFGGRALQTDPIDLFRISLKQLLFRLQPSLRRLPPIRQTTAAIEVNHAMYYNCRKFIQIKNSLCSVIDRPSLLCIRFNDTFPTEQGLIAALKQIEGFLNDPFPVWTERR